MSKLPKIVGVVSSTLAYLAFTTSAFAQVATPSGTKGATAGSLPNAGSTDITYFLFIGGIVLFVFGTLKLVSSFRES